MVVEKLCSEDELLIFLKKLKNQLPILGLITVSVT